MSALFTPFALDGLSLPNRIVIAPMCQYSAVDGNAQDWHLMHLGNLALSGAGMLVIEATGVEPEGRITPACLGLWSDANEAALGRVVEGVRKYSDMPLAIQLGHAGRKASANRPWEGDDHIPADDPSGWTPIGPSAIPFGAHLPRRPEAMSRDDIGRVRQDFAAAARRARPRGYLAPWRPTTLRRPPCAWLPASDCWIF